VGEERLRLEDRLGASSVDDNRMDDAGVVWGVLGLLSVISDVLGEKGSRRVLYKPRVGWVF